MLLALVSPAAAQYEKPVTCMPMIMPDLSAFMLQRFGLTPALSLESDVYTVTTRIMMYVSHETGAWVLIEVYPTASCLLAGGTAPVTYKADGNGT